MNKENIGLWVFGLGILVLLYFQVFKPLMGFIMEIIRKKKDLNKLEIKDRVVQTLKKMNCNPEEDENGWIHFRFQGQQFFIEAQDEYTNIRIFNTWWGKIDLDDTGLYLAKEVVNECNSNCLIPITYSTDKELNQMGIHCKYDLNFQTANGDYENLLGAYLSSFFNSQREFENRLDRKKNEVLENNKRQVIKGFNQNQ